ELYHKSIQSRWSEPKYLISLPAFDITAVCLIIETRHTTSSWLIFQAGGLHMSPEFSFGKIEITADTKQSSSRGMTEADALFRIALLGDFSSHAAHETESHVSLSEQRCLLIDRDNFDQVLAQFGIELKLPAGIASKGTVKLRIAKLEDFHPDRI